MRFGFCCRPQDGALAADAGYDFIELHVQRDLVPEAPEANFAPLRAAIQASPLPALGANCFLPGKLKVVGPAVDPAAQDRYAEVALHRAAEVGMRFIVLGSGGARGVPEGFDHGEARKQFVDFARRAGTFAVRAGVVIVLEPLNRAEVNFLNHTAEGADLVREIAHPGVQLLVDSWHWSQEQEGPADILAGAGLYRHTHVATHGRRAIPGVEPTDYAVFFRALKDCGYDGTCAVEGLSKDPAAEARLAPPLLRAAWAAA